MRNIGGILICLLTLLYSCNKEESWFTTILSVTNISHDVVIVDVEYDLVGNRKEVEVGICYGLDGNPTRETNTFLSKNTINSEVSIFEIDDLNGLTQYFVRGYIKTKDGEIIYSDPFGFKTMELGEAPCDYEEGRVLYETGDVSSSSLNHVGDEDDWRFKSNSWGAEIELSFSQKPVSRIYKTSNEGSFLLSSEVSLKGWVDGGTFTCNYRAQKDQDVYVYVNEEELRVKFCELDISFASGDLCEFEPQKITGHLKN